MKKILLLLLMVFIFINTIHSQVGINTEAPNVLTELDIQNLLNGTDTIPKGIMIPRMTEAKRNEIAIDTNTSNSLMIYNTTEDCYNYYSKLEGEWKSLCGKLGKAQFDFDCSAIVVLGTYIEKKELTPSNRLKIFVTVTKPGSYDITGTTTNGYYFTTSGTFLTSGSYTVYAEGKGTPIAPQVDIVSLSKNGESKDCGTSPVKVTVLTATATYSINCSSLIANGQYVKGKLLVSTNTITLNVNVSNPGSYNIETPLTNGIRFTASGNFAAVGTQSVTLSAVSGSSPTVNADFPITVNTDTPEGNNACTVIIPITLPPMTYAVVGTGDYSWASTQRRNALTNGGLSFGPNGTVKIVSFTQLWSTSNVTTAAGYLTGGFSGGQQPDVVLYFAYGASPNAAITTALISYINRGGCVIYGSADNTSSAVNILINGIFGISTAQAQIAGSPTVDDNTYPIANLPNDPVINGPFGNISGRHWGEDNSSTGSVIMTALPPNSVQIASAYNPYGKATVNPEYSIIWYNDNKNFLYFGDSVATTTTVNQQNDYPASYTSGGFPQSKFYGNYPQPSGAPSQYVYNSALELNAVSWAIKKAAVSGINPH
ncbi:hypothetical protein [Dysgonomonas sp. GY617]|uniref:hypothetical protein n=1 Tax=Dysgonomonas sp. GY617 TaxID=2780420 RepID=UPI001883A291|nr:hypothetical protein [Dysgonomonas sp. GY617]MBF0574832.1 hypothetical protein [Dysgonomonas sp. GY617]